jgi:hypothetical protein
VTFAEDTPPTSYTMLMVNTQLTEDQENHSGWYVVNMSFGNIEDSLLGFEESKYA